MSVLVVHESMWGNTKAVAEAVAEGLGGATVLDVSQAPSPLPDQVRLLVVGGPTHAFSMSRASTREDALARGATPEHEGRGIREWLAELPRAERVGRVGIATFDTRVAKVRHFPGSAAKAAAKEVKRHHLGTLVASESFFVEDYEGPLLPGELDRARDWGASLID
ncbi:MAG: flavodoxin family protein [Nocardioides sp.]|uniref:flavodoxin family protein n=1 Tax=Nocardioides sp. TaxID=35761 RepID=UPI003F073710